MVGPEHELAGSSATDLLRSGLDITDMLVAVALGLRDLHARPGNSCPFDSSPDSLLAEASARVGRGVVTVDQFDPAYRRYEPDRLLDLAISSQPAKLDPADQVVIHGDARLGTVWIDQAHVSGWTSWTRGGAGDRYRDLATMAADLAGTVGPEALGPFVDAYGLVHADVVRLDWHLMVDQMLR